MTTLTTAQYQHRSGSNWVASNEFRVFGVQYDRDGKIISKEVQNGPSADPLYMHYYYFYASGTNRITSIYDDINQDYTGSFTKVGE